MVRRGRHCPRYTAYLGIGRWCLRRRDGGECGPRRRNDDHREQLHSVLELRRRERARGIRDGDSSQGTWMDRSILIRTRTNAVNQGGAGTVAALVALGWSCAVPVR